MPRFLLAALLAALPLSAFAQVHYITDKLQVPLRNSPCANCTEVHPGLTPGTPLTVISREDDWARVTTEEGSSGWLPSFYLTTRQVSGDRYASLNNDNQLLRTENDQLKKQLAEVTLAYEELETLHASHEDTLSTLEVELSSVKKLSNNSLALQEQNEELIKRNRILQSDFDVLTANRDQLLSDSRQRWFLYGGLTLALGALLAALLPSLRSRRRYSEWL